MDNLEDISIFILTRYDGLRVIDAWGEKSFFYNPDNLLKRGIYFCTLKDKDGDNDKASQLNRNGVYRLNFGISKQSFLNLFDSIPKRPAKGSCIKGEYLFTELDKLTPHPVYGWMSWVSILSPSNESWDKIEELLSESYVLVCKKYKAKKFESGAQNDGREYNSNVDFYLK